MGRPTSPPRTTAQINRLIASIAVDGVFSLETAIAAGVPARAVQRRVESGQLVRLAHAVYGIAGARTPRTLQRAALFASGSRALAVWSAGHAHGCVHAPKLVHVAIDRKRYVRPSAWFRAHRLRPLEDDEITELWDMPVCTMARAIRDYAAVLPRRDWADVQLRRLTEEALALGRLEVADLERMLERERGTSIVRRLDDLIAYETGRDSADLKSEGERWLRDLIVRRGWPMPRFNVVIPGTGHQGDAYWELEGVVVEFDGFQVHRHRAKFDRDRRRDRLARRSGIITIRITSTDFRDHRDELEDDIERCLGLAPT